MMVIFIKEQTKAPIRLFLFFITAFLLSQWLFLVTAEASKSRLKIKEPLVTKLKNILDESEALHRALVAKNDSVVNSQLKSLMNSVEKAQSFSYLAGDNSLHLNKILNAIKLRLIDVQNAETDHDKKLFYIKETYRQLVQIPKLYETKTQYKVFWCLRDEDRSVWIQNSSRAINPFDPDGKLKNCGSPMPI